MSSRPDWLKVRIPSGESFFEVRRILRAHKLNTICEDAMCPNIAECWGKHRTATFMILGDICTRACAFCAVQSGKPTEYDAAEPARVAAAIALEGTVEDLVNTIHAHPTLAEATHEAAEAVFGAAIHI